MRCLRNCAATASTDSSRISAAITVAPCVAKLRQIHSPSPRPPPVTRATCPFRLFMFASERFISLDDLKACCARNGKSRAKVSPRPLQRLTPKRRRQYEVVAMAGARHAAGTTSPGMNIALETAMDSKAFSAEQVKIYCRLMRLAGKALYYAKKAEVRGYERRRRRLCAKAIQLSSV